MGKTVRCRECSKVYRNPEELEELRDNDSICMVCNAPIEVADWDQVLGSWDADGDLDDVDDVQEEDLGGEEQVDAEDPDDEDLDDLDDVDDLDDADDKADPGGKPSRGTADAGPAR